MDYGLEAHILSFGGGLHLTAIDFIGSSRFSSAPPRTSLFPFSSTIHPEMRRVSGLASVRRAVEGVAAGNYSNQRHDRLFQAALFSTNSSSNSSAKSHWFSNNRIYGNQSASAAAHTFAGTMLFSVTATTLAEEVHAKEPVQLKFRPKDVVLYQYEACPFCNKVKAFLDYYDIPYKIVEVNPISKKEIKWSDYKKVPILMVDGEQMVNSSEVNKKDFPSSSWIFFYVDIIDKLTKKIHPDLPADSVGEDSEEKKWRGWVDNHLVHILSPNIYRSTSEALESFDYITSHGNFSFTERITAKYAGAAAMYFVSKKLKKKYNITDERASLYEAAETWVDALKGQDFLGGTKPNLADLAVYGVLRPIRYLKSGQDMVENTRIGDWYSRMESAVGVSSKIQA
ncbi:glutathione S-transferase family protein [Striga asiatica]|uniref:Prostaglandin E synthase 2 n=1 Tax=Striga asiatica TaxID=4170 RepID=A0A5A7PMX9_STRAF|nr:glutathione S-transferase family protein [Striga asiatica]